MQIGILTQGELPEGWAAQIFSEAIVVNPKRELKKGTKSKFVSMADIKEFDKKIQRHTIKKFSGGSKFFNSDTLMARITPCLENGKTAFVDILDEGEVASGSTEFIVLSAKKGKTVPQFVYYTAISPKIRATAIKSMIGTSGRQRVENNVFDKITIAIPPIPEQEEIANLLKTLDDKIALNRQMNATLEAIGQALFKYWFVDFEFSNEEGKPYKSSGGEMVDSDTEFGGIPKEWRVGTIGNLIDVQGGFAFKSSDFLDEGIIGIVKIKNISEGVADINNTQYIDKETVEELDSKFKIMPRSVLIAMTGAEVAKIGVVPNTNKELWLNQRVGMFTEKEDGGLLFSYILLTSQKYQELLKNKAYGSAQPNMSSSDIESIQTILPNNKSLVNFKSIFEHIFIKITDNLYELDTLSQIRDALIPKLMSGEIRVPVEVKS